MYVCMYVCMYICVHDCHMQYVRRRNDRTMLLHEIVEIVNHMDDVRRQLMQAFTMIHTHLQYTHVRTCAVSLLPPQFYSTITSFKVRMALIEVKAYTSSNPITITRDPSATLTLWKAHFAANIHESVPADAALLFA